MHCPRPFYNLLTLYVKQNEWIHLSIGILGNIFFLIGTIFFIYEHPYASKFFLFGAIGMLVNAIGSLLAKCEYKGKTAFTYVGESVRRQAYRDAEYERDAQ